MIIVLFLSLYIFLVAVCETNEILTFTAHERGTVEIQCSYKSRYEEDKKYLCRGECPRLNKDKVVESGSAARDERFSLTDDKTAHIFTVTITDVRTEDEGKYWCGIETGLGKLDDFTEICLEIKHGKSEYTVCVSLAVHMNTVELKSDVKFICKGSDPSLCEKSAIRVSSESNSNGRFSLSDNEPAGVFTVTITDLREEDSGIYWCGAARRRQDMSSKPTTTTASFHTSKPAPADTASSRPVTSSSSSSSSPSTSPSVLMFFLSSANAVSPKPQPGTKSVQRHLFLKFH
uniref:Si:ch211-114l13.12 n=1 Tax=Sinocyclocheilus rhinocerous TaxID=307959 RepID=A0A673J6G9_9TELE